MQRIGKRILSTTGLLFFLAVLLLSVEISGCKQTASTTTEPNTSSHLTAASEKEDAPEIPPYISETDTDGDGFDNLSRIPPLHPPPTRGGIFRPLASPFQPN